MSTPPKHLGAHGRRLWRTILADFELSGHETALLLEACSVADTCAGLRAHVEAEGVMVLDRFGEPRANAALVELRQQQALFSRLLVALRVPLGDQEEDGGTAGARGQRRRGRGGVYGIAGGVS